MKRNLVFLILILIVAATVRFYGLSTTPALNADEASIGYDAYSLIRTGMDQHGNPWPIHFQSFNDYKPGLIVYLILPFIKIFGLNVLAVRFLPAALGVASVLALYLLVKELFENENLSLISALFFAISPWHIHFSRGAWEVNVATFFILCGTLLFLKASKNPKNYIASAIFFVLSLYTYHAARIVSPLLVLGLIAFKFSDIKKYTKMFLIAGVVGGIVMFPLARDLLGPAGASRLSGVGLFADTGPLNRINELRGEHGDISSLPAKLFHNKLTSYSLAFFQNWSEHYWGEFLFLSGDEIQRNKVPETGQMYMLDILFAAVGVFALIKRRENWGIMLWWLIIAPIPAAFTFQSPHALRAQNMVVPLVVISAYGVLTVVDWLKRFKNKNILSAGIVLLAIGIFWGFSRYEIMYWFHMVREYPYSSQYGVSELVDYVKENQDKYSKVLVTDRYDQPYILFLYYLKYPPEKFQKEHTLTARDGFGFSTVRNFDKYEFRSIKFDEDRPIYQNTLIAGTAEEIPDEANIVRKIYGPNGFLYFKVVMN